MSHVESRTYIPNLPIVDTEEFVYRMPNKGWVLPHPYEIYDTENGMQEKADYLFVRWILFLNVAYRGFLIEKLAVEEHIITGDLYSIQTYNCLCIILKSLKGSDFKDIVSSTRRGFAALVSNEEIERLRNTNTVPSMFTYLGDEEEFRLSLSKESTLLEDRDIFNARMMVGEMNRYFGTGRNYFREAEE